MSNRQDRIAKVTEIIVACEECAEINDNDIDLSALLGCCVIKLRDYIAVLDTLEDRQKLPPPLDWRSVRLPIPGEVAELHRGFRKIRRVL